MNYYKLTMVKLTPIGNYPISREKTFIFTSTVSDIHTLKERFSIFPFLFGIEPYAIHTYCPPAYIYSCNELYEFFESNYKKKDKMKINNKEQEINNLLKSLDQTAKLLKEAFEENKKPIKEEYFKPGQFFVKNIDKERMSSNFVRMYYQEQTIFILSKVGPIYYLVPIQPSSTIDNIAALNLEKSSFQKHFSNFKPIKPDRALAILMSNYRIDGKITIEDQ